MYRVGQILFVILNKRQQVIPVQVNEQVVRRSLTGEDVSYTVLIPAKNDDKLYNLDEVDGDVYETIDDVREVMHDHATRIITDITDKAVAIARARFEHNVNPLDDIVTSSDDTGEEPGIPPEDHTVQVTLENGTVANVRLPDNL